MSHPNPPTADDSPARSAREWIDAFAIALNVESPDDATVEKLLELASVAAHSSERMAAPIACWMIGRAGASATEAVELAHNV